MITSKKVAMSQLQRKLMCFVDKRESKSMPLRQLQ